MRARRLKHLNCSSFFGGVPRQERFLSPSQGMDRPKQTKLLAGSARERKMGASRRETVRRQPCTDTKLISILGILLIPIPGRAKFRESRRYFGFIEFEQRTMRPARPVFSA
jgi:hypothetical protein